MFNINKNKKKFFYIMIKNLIKNLSILAILSFGSGALNAQVTVGSNSEPKATLEVIATATDSKPAGIIAPRMDRKYLNDNEGKYTSALAGTIIYVNNILNGSATNQAVNVYSVGYYYFDGTKWIPMRTTTTAENGLTLTGTAVKLGGTLSQPTTINLANNNLIFSRSTGNIGIGTNAPAKTLHVEGNARITNTPASTDAHDSYLVVDKSGNVLSRSATVARMAILAKGGTTDWSKADPDSIRDFYFVDRAHFITLPLLNGSGDGYTNGGTIEKFAGRLIRFYIYGGPGAAESGMQGISFKGVKIPALWTVQGNISNYFHYLDYNGGNIAMPLSQAIIGMLKVYDGGGSPVANPTNSTQPAARFRFIDIICDGSNWWVDNK